MADSYSRLSSAAWRCQIGARHGLPLAVASPLPAWKWLAARIQGVTDEARLRALVDRVLSETTPSATAAGGR